MCLNEHPKAFCKLLLSILKLTFIPYYSNTDTLIRFVVAGELTVFSILLLFPAVSPLHPD